MWLSNVLIAERPTAPWCTQRRAFETLRLTSTPNYIDFAPSCSNHCIAFGPAFQLIASLSPRRSAQHSDPPSLQTQNVLVLRDDSELLLFEALEYEGRLWFALEWIPGPDIGCERPKRLISLDNLLTVNADGRHGADLEVVTRLSNNFLEGREPMEGVSQVNNPDIFRRVHTG